MTRIKHSGYKFGAVEVPRIPGFQVVVARGEWMTARRGHKTYVIRETPTHWIMERFDFDCWSRRAPRLRREVNREAMRLHSNSSPLMRMAWRGFAGERSKGVRMVDPTEAIAVRK